MSILDLFKAEIMQYYTDKKDVAFNKVEETDKENLEYANKCYKARKTTV